MDLYALPPEEFTAARDAAAKEDKGLKALRKPTVAAWIVNTLVREQEDLLNDVLELGQSLAEAQANGQGHELRELTAQRHQLVQAVTQQAVALVGRKVAESAKAEVAATIEAAMADPASAEAVKTGQLVRSLSYAGFGGGVDLDGAVADVPRPQAAKPSGESKRVQKLEAVVLNAQGALDDAVRHAEKAARELEAAGTAAEEAQQQEDVASERVEEARQTLAQAEKEQSEARSARTKAQRDAEESSRKAERATAAVSKAQDASETARKALDEARRR